MNVSGIVMGVACATLAGSASAASRPRAISWAELRPTLAGAFCADKVEVRGRVIYTANFGSTGCPATPRKTPLQRTVIRAFEDSRAVLMLSVQSEPARKAQEIVDPERRRHAYADALLADPHFLRTLLLGMKSDSHLQRLPENSGSRAHSGRLASVPRLRGRARLAGSGRDAASSQRQEPNKPPLFHAYLLGDQRNFSPEQSRSAAGARGIRGRLRRGPRHHGHTALQEGHDRAPALLAHFGPGKDRIPAPPSR